MPPLPRLLITLGDVAGIGPEIVARAWPDLCTHARPVVVGDPPWLERGLALAHRTARVVPVGAVNEVEPTPTLIPCLVATDQDLSDVRVGDVSAAAGRAAYDWLCRAIVETLARRADGLVTAPLHKEG